MSMIECAYNQFATRRFKLPSDAQVLALEQRIGVQLPNDYRSYILNFNGGFFSEPEIQTDDDEAAGDALACMHGIDSGNEISELANPRRLALFADIDLPNLLPIGHTSLGGFILIETEEERRGMIYLKKPFGDFYPVANNIEEFFGLLREWQE